MKNPNVLLFGSVILILLAVGLVAILDRTSPASQTSDIRARAGTAFTLKLIGTVVSTDEAKGTLVVNGVHFAAGNLAGQPSDLGTWTVAVPPNFNFGPIVPGSQVTIGVDAKTFVVTSHSMTAITLVPGVTK